MVWRVRIMDQLYISRNSGKSLQTRAWSQTHIRVHLYTHAHKHNYACVHVIKSNASRVNVTWNVEHGFRSDSCNIKIYFPSRVDPLPALHNEMRIMKISGLLCVVRFSCISLRNHVSGLRWANLSSETEALIKSDSLYNYR